MLDLLVAIALAEGRCRRCGDPLQASLVDILEHYGVAHRDAVILAAVLSVVIWQGARSITSRS